ncbi:MAG: hypothetical protein FJ039_06525 [Chloroflexi bacterium]|nr:hypothetical protein [Chloroflexota bacterium]
MAIVHRRTFFGKPGEGDKIIALLKQGEKLFIKFGMKYKARILSDYNSGRTDRIIWEWEVSSLGQLDADMEKAMKDPKAGAEFGAWFGKLTPLITHAEVDNLAVK